jgi:hypothetical protein
MNIYLAILLDREKVDYFFGAGNPLSLIICLKTPAEVFAVLLRAGSLKSTWYKPNF